MCEYEDQIKAEGGLSALPQMTLMFNVNVKLESNNEFWVQEQ